MKKIILFFILFFSLILSGCSTNQFSSTGSQEILTSSNTLVVYFSATGNTKNVAEIIAQDLDASLDEIIPSTPYTTEELTLDDGEMRPVQENSNPNARPEISETVNDISKYDFIFIGYPIWYDKAPKVIYTFLDQYDFSGKTIIPFCTSENSEITQSVSNIKPLAPTATWLEGKRFDQDPSQEEILKWLDSIEIK